MTERGARVRPELEPVAAALRARRESIEGEVRRLTKPREPGTALQYGKRVSEGTSEAVEQLNTSSTARTLDSLARQIDRALEKIEEGSYGSCDDCGAAIPPERLEAIPWTALCLICSSARTSGRR
jgi:DnaK suppressor protein